MDIRPTHQLDRFGGIDNVHERTELKETTKELGTFYFLSEADNTDLNDLYQLQRRVGHRTVLSMPSDIHSLWSDGQDCFFVSGDTLYRLDEHWAYHAILSGLANRRMVFVTAFDDVYFTNGVIIGYIPRSTGIPVMLPTATGEFKYTMPAGHLIEFYRSVLYVAYNDMIFCSDPLKIRQYDIRHGIIPQLGRLTMLKATDRGLWISDSRSIYYLSGSTHYDFTNDKKYDLPVLENGSITIDSKNTGLDSSGKVVLMATKNGFFIGTNDGALVQATKEHYHIPAEYIPQGLGYKWAGDKHQCFLTGRLYPSIEEANIMVSSPPLDISSEANQPWSLPMFIVAMTGTTA